MVGLIPEIDNTTLSQWESSQLEEEISRDEETKPKSLAISQAKSLESWNDWYIAT